MSVGGVSAEFPSLQQAERAIASMFHQHAQDTDPTCPAVARWGVLSVAYAADSQDEREPGVERAGSRCPAPDLG